MQLVQGSVKRPRATRSNHFNGQNFAPESAARAESAGGPGSLGHDLEAGMNKIWTLDMKSDLDTNSKTRARWTLILV